MKKFFISWLVMLVMTVCLFGCGGGDGGSSTSEPSPIPTPEPTPHFIEVDDFMTLTVPVDKEGLIFSIIVKDDNWNAMSDILVRAEFVEFYGGELQEEMRIQEANTNAEGKVEFLIPQHYEKGEREVTVWLPNFPEVEAITPTIKYVLPGIPTRLVVADPAQVEISLLFGENVEVVFVVLDTEDNPVEWIEVAVVVGGEYVGSPTTILSDTEGKTPFLFIAGDVSDGTVLRAQIVDYPLIFAEVVISWTEGPTGIPTVLEIVNVSKWEGNLPVIVITEGEPFDILFKLTDDNRYPVENALVQSEFPTGSSATTDAYGLATITIPPCSRPQGVDTARAWVTNYSETFINFKIEYLLL